MYSPLVQPSAHDLLSRCPELVALRRRLACHERRGRDQTAALDLPARRRLAMVACGYVPFLTSALTVTPAALALLGLWPAWTAWLGVAFLLVVPPLDRPPHARPAAAAVGGDRTVQRRLSRLVVHRAVAGRLQPPAVDRRTLAPRPRPVFDVAAPLGRTGRPLRLLDARPARARPPARVRRPPRRLRRSALRSTRTSWACPNGRAVLRAKSVRIGERRARRRLQRPDQRRVDRRRRGLAARKSTCAPTPAGSTAAACGRGRPVAIERSAAATRLFPAVPADLGRRLHVARDRLRPGRRGACSAGGW